MITSEVRDALLGAGLDPAYVMDLVARTIAEDLDGGVDATSVATIPAEQRSTLDFVSRGTGTVAGVWVGAAVFTYLDCNVIRVVLDDGTRVIHGDTILSVSGPTRTLLLGERTALNLMCHLSGVATATSQWVDAIAGTSARVRDTRKTTPGMRVLEKYAVRCGGGVNHRMSLSDAALVKDNHVIAAGGVAEAFRRVREEFPSLAVEVEVDSLAELEEALQAGADLILLDNFTTEQMRAAVRLTEGRSLLEASGGLTIDVAGDVAATGVDYLAVGALTHSAPVLDIGADLRPEED
jgi:nicotinate-nucleotide pyrophosphorylase (carboxylating)